MLKLSCLSPESTAAYLRPAPLATWDDYAPTDYLLTVKGAPDVLFPRCGSVVNPAGGQPIPLNKEVLARIVTIQDKWASQGQRVLILARKIIKEEEIPKSTLKSLQAMDELMNDLNEDLVIVGLVALTDPLKDDVAETVRLAMFQCSLVLVVDPCVGFVVVLVLDFSSWLVLVLSYSQFSGSFIIAF